MSQANAVLDYAATISDLWPGFKNGFRRGWDKRENSCYSLRMLGSHCSVSTQLVVLLSNLAVVSFHINVISFD